MMKKLLAIFALLMVMVAAHAGTITYVYSDPQGTPLAEADANGNIIATYDYTPYGTVAVGTPPKGPGYTGHVNDPEAELIYMQARYYDPATGHFLSVDPLKWKAGNAFNFNRYNYANGNPLVIVDPTGQYNCDTKGNKTNCQMLKEGLEKIKQASKSFSAGSPQARALAKILKFYGKENDGNTVSIAFREIDGVSNGQTHYDQNAGALITFDVGAIKTNFGGLGNDEAVEVAATVAHEGQHGVDAFEKGGDPVGYNQRYQTEYNAFMSQSLVNQGLGVSSVYDVWSNDWPGNFAEGYRAWESDLQAQCATASSLCVAR